MRRRLAGLVALNAVLAAVLAGLFMVPAPAGAQPTLGTPGGGAARARGTYTMLAGRPRSGSGSVVYVIDSVNQETITLKWNESRNVLEGLGYRNMSRDLGQATGR
jgi:hypothetical protein